MTAVAPSTVRGPGPVVAAHLKVILVGDAGAGKSSLLQVLKTGVPLLAPNDPRGQPPAPTIGMDWCELTLFAGQPEQLHLRLWDTAGTERFGPLMAQYTRDAVGVLVVLDGSAPPAVTNARMEHWLAFVAEACGPGTVLGVLVTKKDLAPATPPPPGTIPQAQALATANGACFAECSAREPPSVRTALSLYGTWINTRYRAIKAAIEARQRAELARVDGAGRVFASASTSSAVVVPLRGRTTPGTSGTMGPTPSKHGCCY
jgi:small GTP-binding protein